MYKRRITPKKRKPPFWQIIGLLVSAVLFVVGQLLIPEPETEDARAGDLDDFGFPTALESRPIPVLWGTNRLESPNVIWYGDLRAIPIIERVPKGGLFAGKKDVTVGHKYWLGFDLALCYGAIDAVTEIRVGEKGIMNAGLEGIPASGLSDSSSSGVAGAVNLPNLWGGHKHGGGLIGSYTLYSGNTVQDPDPYVISRINDPASKTFVPGYNGLAHLVWEGGVIGESTTIRKWDLTVHRYPNTLNIAPEKAIIDPNTESGHGDANPVCCLYEILTNVDYGLGISVSLIDIAEWQAAAELVFDEGNGFSFMALKSSAASKVANEILRQIDAQIYQGTDGKMHIKMIREDYTIADLPLFDESNIVEAKSISKMAWSDTQNSIHLEYVARDEEFKSTIAVAQDIGNITMNSGQQNVNKVKFPGVRTASVAAAIAQRELAAAATPLLTATLHTNRDAGDLFPGDVIKVVFPDYGLEEQIMRVSEINKGTLKDAKCTVKCVQDVFGVSQFVNYVGGGTSFHENVSLDPSDATNQFVRGLTAWERFEHDRLGADDPGPRTVSVVEAPDYVSVNFKPFMQIAGEYIEAANESTSTPTATILENTADDTYVLNRVSDIYVATGPNDDLGNPTPAISISDFNIPAELREQTEAQISELGLGLIQIGEEILGFESFATEVAAEVGAYLWYGEDTSDGPQFNNDNRIIGLNGVHRGLLDTDILDHAVGDTVWFMSSSDLAVNDTSIYDIEGGVSSSKKVKHQMISPGGTTDLSTAGVNTVDSAEMDRALKPIRPANITVQGNEGAASHGVDTGSSDIQLEWANHNPTMQSNVVFLQDWMGFSPDVTESSDKYFDNSTMQIEWQKENVEGDGTFVTFRTVNLTANTLSPTSSSWEGPGTTGIDTDDWTVNEYQYTQSHSQLATDAGWVGPFDTQRTVRVVLTRIQMDDLQKDSGVTTNVSRASTIGAWTTTARVSPWREVTVNGNA